MSFRIKKGDKVRVITGKDRGKEGAILRVLPPKGRVLVEGVNLKKKHERARRRGEKGTIITLPHPIHISNVMLICRSCGQPTRVMARILPVSSSQTRKERVCKKCGASVP